MVTYRYVEIGVGDEERLVPAVLRCVAESVLGLVLADLDLTGGLPRVLRWFRLAVPGEKADFETDEPIHGRCPNVLGDATVWISAGFDPHDEGDMLALARIVAHEARHSQQVRQYDRALDWAEMQRREADAYGFAADWVREHRAELEGEIQMVRVIARRNGMSKSLSDLSDNELKKLLDKTDTAIAEAKVEVAEMWAAMRAAGAKHSAAERATAAVGALQISGRTTMVINTMAQAVEERDRQTAHEVASAEARRVDAEFAERQAVVAHSRAYERVRALRRAREALLHGWGGRDWRLARQREKERGVHRPAAPPGPAQEPASASIRAY